MSFAMKPPVRRTLPAPSEPLNVEGLRADRDRLRAERDELRARLDAREEAARESVFLIEEVSRLRAELARTRAAPVTRAIPEPVARWSPPDLPDDVGPLPAPSSMSGITGGALFRPTEVPTGSFQPSAGMDSRGLDFGTVSRLSPNELDQLPYGLICLDAQGRVVHYNDTESRMAMLPKERVIGRSFFGEVAPCARVREFEGEFQELVRDPSRIRVRTFDFIFRFRHSEQHVTIVMTPARQRGLYNVALLRRNVIPR